MKRGAIPAKINIIASDGPFSLSIQIALKS